MNVERVQIGALPLDGERFIPGEMQGAVELEHVHRYSFASQFVSNKIVLDIACGEGYGTALLARSARRVFGVDIAEIAIKHAVRRYQGENIEFLLGSCTNIPLADGSVDVIVSFETLEHHGEHDAMMREFTRVLRPGGLLVISSPDRLEYSDKPSFRNPFHVKELYREEFESLLAQHFRNVRLLGQRVVFGSMLLDQRRPKSIHFHRQAAEYRAAGLEPVYWVALASAGRLPPALDSVYERSVVELWAQAEKQRGADTTRLIRLAAVPNSDRLKSSLSDPWYLQRNADVVAAGVDPYEHWLGTGADEGRLPSSDPRSLLEELLREREQILKEEWAATEREAADEMQRTRAREAAEHQSLVQRENLLKDHLHRVQGQLQEVLNQREQRERAFTTELLEQQNRFDSERTAQRAVVEQRISSAASEHLQREQQLRQEIERLQDRVQLEQDQARETVERMRRDSDEKAERAERQRGMLQDELRGARDQINSLLRELAAREAAAAQMLAQQQVEFESERARDAEVAERRLEKLEAQYAGRERDILRDVQQLREELDQTRREAGEQVQAQLQQSAIREQTVARALLEQQAGFNEQLTTLTAEFAKHDVQLRQEALALQVRCERTIADERARVRAEYSAVLMLLKKDIEAMETSVSWRLGAPIRAVAALFGSRTRFPQIEPIGSLTRLPPNTTE